MSQKTHLPLEVVILAAGKGTRMFSDLPKVLHPLAGRPLVEHVALLARELEPQRVHIVYGYGGERVPRALDHLDVQWALQAEQKGTGHAVQQALPGVAQEAVVLVLYGDVPLTRIDTLTPLVQAARAGDLAVLTMELTDPTGYGRILRDALGRVRSIVEQKDATPDQLGLREVNTGILAVAAAHLKKWLEIGRAVV